LTAARFDVRGRERGVGGGGGIIVSGHGSTLCPGRGAGEGRRCQAVTTAGSLVRGGLRRPPVLERRLVDPEDLHAERVAVRELLLGTRRAGPPHAHREIAARAGGQ